MKKHLLLSSMLMLMGIGMANAEDAQKVYVYVQQNNVPLPSEGTAVYAMEKENEYTTPFVTFSAQGEACVCVNGVVTAKLPTANGGQLVVDFDNLAGCTNPGKLEVAVPSSGYATLYSPFMLTMPESEIKVFAPKYDSSTQSLDCTSDNEVTTGEEISLGNGLLLKGKGTLTFDITAKSTTSTTHLTSDLKGTALTMSKPDVAQGNAIYTLGNDGSNYGFVKYNDIILDYGMTYIEAEKELSSASYIPFKFDDETPTAITTVENVKAGMSNRKYIENGRVVIENNGKKFNLNGQELK